MIDYDVFNSELDESLDILEDAGTLDVIRNFTHSQLPENSSN